MAFLLTIGIVQGQSHKITTGVVAYNQGQYDEAVAKIDEGLADESQLDNKYIAKGRLYRAKALIRMCPYGKDPGDNHREACYMHAYDDLKKCIEIGDDRYVKDAKQELTYIGNYLLQEGLNFYNSGLRNKRTAEYDEALKRFDAVIDIFPDQSFGYEYRGNVHSALLNDQKAIEDYKKAIEIINKQEIQSVSILSIYTYVRLATVYKSSSSELALKTIDEGRIKLAEIKFLDGANFKQEQYEQASEYLEKTRLDILKNSPNKQEAIEAFEQSLQQEPNNLTIRVVYASLLEDVGQKEKAVEQYKLVLEQDSMNLNANYNLGAYYVNRAVEELNKDAEPEAITKLMEQAFPYMKRAFKLSPDVTTASTLIQITSLLGKYNQMKYYNDQKKKLEQGH
ncbi:MAG: tetratricopeptide repeat protein [Bacteroidetes bacterium]|nr:tetratricopeptide repeat protein [Bacteroidota bacterium]